MDFDGLIGNLTTGDLEWLVPVLAGLLVIVGALLAGIIRGMTAGVIVALLVGGLLAMSPTLVSLLAPAGGRLSEAGAGVSLDAARLAEANSAAVTDLGRAVGEVRAALEALEPLVAAAEDADGQLPAGEFRDAVADFRDAFADARDNLSRSAELSGDLGGGIAALEQEMRRRNLEAGRLGQ